MKKILSLGVILLFIGLALAPCIDGDSKVKIVSRSKISEYNKLRSRYDIESLRSQVDRIKDLMEQRDYEDCDCRSKSNENGYPYYICLILRSIYDGLIILWAFINMIYFGWPPFLFIILSFIVYTSLMTMVGIPLYFIHNTAVNIIGCPEAWFPL